MTHETPLRPAGLYGASKIWGEAIARHYADAYGLSAICVRIGRVRAEDRPTAAREFSVFCSQRDVVRMLELCIAAPAALKFDIFYCPELKMTEQTGVHRRSSFKHGGRRCVQ